EPGAGGRDDLRDRRGRGREDSPQGRTGHHTLGSARDQQDRPRATRRRGPRRDGARRTPAARHAAVRLHEPPHRRRCRRDRRMAAQGSAAGASGLMPALARVGRDGALTLRVERRGARSVLTGCRWTLPLQVLAPVALDDAALIVSVLNPTGGLVGGDRLVVDIEVGADAHACLTTPSATKVYRTAASPAEQTVRLTLAPGARLEWVPDHTIPFAGAALRQRIEADVAEGAVLFVV